MWRFSVAAWVNLEVQTACSWVQFGFRCRQDSCTGRVGFTDADEILVGKIEAYDFLSSAVGQVSLIFLQIPVSIN